MKSLALTALLVPSLVLAGAMGFEEAKHLADTNEASLDADVTSSIIEAQGKSLGAAMAHCGKPGMDFAAFTLVFRLDSDGSVAESWRKGETPLANCVHEMLVASGFPGSWRAPFYTSIELSFEDS